MREYIVRRLANIDEPVDGENFIRVLDYSEATGEFRWKERPVEMFKDSGYGVEYTAKAWNARYAGKIAGRVHEVNGYRYILFASKRYLAHRLAWLLTSGVWPDCEIDHINGNRDDNRIANLRDVSRRENRRNQALSKRNTSGVVGVHRDGRTGNWIASITIDGRLKHLGVFAEKVDAIEARQAANKQYGFHANHGRAA